MLRNFSQSKLPILICKNGTTQRWLLVRLNYPMLLKSNAVQIVIK